MKESDFMTIYNYDKHQDYKFEYKKDHILVDKFYTTTNKYAPYTSLIIYVKIGMLESIEKKLQEQTIKRLANKYNHGRIL